MLEVHAGAEVTGSPKRVAVAYAANIFLNINAPSSLLPSHDRPESSKIRARACPSRDETEIDDDAILLPSSRRPAEASEPFSSIAKPMSMTDPRHQSGLVAALDGRKLFLPQPRRRTVLRKGHGKNGITRSSQTVIGPDSCCAIPETWVRRS